MAKVAITGITGLAGGHVARALRASGHDVLGISRSVSEHGTVVVPDLADAAALAQVLVGCDALLHFADRADRCAYTEGDIEAAAKVLAALRTACAENDIRRLVAASSIYAERSDDRYGRSKRAMEAVALAPSPGSPAVVLRFPPLYGPGTRGAVRHIVRAIEMGIPLPFALATAPRRFFSLDSLADLCLHLVGLDHSAFARAAGEVFVPVDVRQSSLAKLTRTLGGDSARLLPIPGIDRLLGGSVSAEQIMDDHRRLRDALGWEAPTAISRAGEQL